MTHKQLRDRLARRIRESGKSKARFAREDLGRSDAYLHDVLVGKRPPTSPSVLQCLGLSQEEIDEIDRAYRARRTATANKNAAARRAAKVKGVGSNGTD